MSASILCLLLLLHFIADFVLQSREMGKKKSEEPLWLMYHISIHFVVFTVGLFPVLGFYNALTLSGINALLHSIVDLFVWNGYKVLVVWRFPDLASEDLKKNFRYWDDHLFYTTIGFDQLLHGISLIIAYGMISD